MINWSLQFADIDGLVQDYSISSALAMQILQSCTKPSIFVETRGTKYSWIGNGNVLVQGKIDQGQLIPIMLRNHVLWGRARNSPRKPDLTIWNERSSTERGDGGWGGGDGGWGISTSCAISICIMIENTSISSCFRTIIHYVKLKTLFVISKIVNGLPWITDFGEMIRQPFPLVFMGETFVIRAIHRSYHDDVIKWKNIFRVTGLLCGEFTDHRWIPRT